MDVSRYVQKQASGIYRYYRRVPAEVANLDRRTFVKKSLKTKNHKEALERADPINASTERLWAALAAGKGTSQNWERHEAAVRLAQSLGFSYRPISESATEPLALLDARISAAMESASQHPEAEVALAGLAPEPNPRVSDVWEMYEDHNRAGLMGMSPRQREKHKSSRLRALTYLKAVLGDILLKNIDRAGALKFRNWWTDKIAREGLRADSANRSFSDIAGMMTVIDGALQTEFHAVFEKVRIKATNKTKQRKRPPFPPEWVQKNILKPGALATMTLECQLIVYTMVETGMRLGEVCNLREEDIHLDDEVPHLDVAERDDRRQKTDYSIRRVPLVGVSLWAMQQAPKGFERYADKADNASSSINNLMNKAGLRPTPRHTVYSLRHTFQDRIENAGASDRMQADLMGHEFGRPTYGDGAEMKRRQELLERIQFKWG